MAERIIVGIDDSGPSRAALRWAMSRARSTEGEVLLEHVVDDEWGQVGTDYAREETREGELILGRAVDQSLAFGRPVEARLAHGSPAWTLAKDARPGNLLVVGTHKTGYLRGRVLGTRSVVVASVADCSVVVVPEEHSSQRQGVVVGVAGGDASRAAVVAGAVEAKRLHQELSLIHSAPESRRPDDSRELLAAAADLAAATAPGVTVRRRVSPRRTTDALLDASRTAALLVLGASRVDPDRGGFIGSVIHEVLLNLNAPVMVAR